jgi:hypothetical protein
LATGESLKGVTVRLTPTGTVSGRIQERDNRQPVAGVPVQLMRVQYGYNGERTLNQSFLARTNDRGEYRLYFVTPGRYYLNVGGVLSQRGAALPRTAPNEMSVNYASVYYPGVATSQDATIVDVKPGADLGGMDLSVATQNLYRIRGRVIDARTGQPPASTNISIYRRSDTRWEFVNQAGNIGTAERGFEFRQLVPGSYQLVVTATATPPRFLQSVPSVPAAPRVINVAFRAGPAQAPAETPGYATKLTPVEISGSDVDGLVISMSPGVPVAGRVRFEGQPLSAADLNRLQVSVISPDKLLTSYSKVTGDATFRFDNLAPHEYRISVSGLPAGFFVKEARLGGLDALRSPVQISEREANGLNVVISSNVAAVDGTVTNDKLEPVAASVVVLIPDRERDRIELFQRVNADRTGHFNFASVPPGNYRAFAWEALEPYAYFDPELLRQVEQRAKSVQLTESSKQTLTLTAIPAN